MNEHQHNGEMKIRQGIEKEIYSTGIRVHISSLVIYQCRVK
jgi:hypothetical protein